MLREASGTPAVSTWLKCHTVSQCAQADLALQVFKLTALSGNVVRGDSPLLDAAAAGSDSQILNRCVCQHVQLGNVQGLEALGNCNMGSLLQPEMLGAVKLMNSSTLGSASMHLVGFKYTRTLGLRVSQGHVRQANLRLCCLMSSSSHVTDGVAQICLHAATEKLKISGCDLLKSLQSTITKITQL